jgi:DUF1680 family protein
MRVTFDAQDRTLAIDQDGIYPWGANISAVINRHGQTISLEGVSFSIAVEIDGELCQECTWPLSGVKFVRTDQDCIAAHQLHWEPGQSVTVTAALQSPNVDLTESVSFAAPVPVVDNDVSEEE